MTQAKPRTRTWHDQDVVEMLGRCLSPPRFCRRNGYGPGAAIRWAKSSHADPSPWGGVFRP